MNEYGERFYSRRQAGVIRSARQVVPAIVELVKPASVVDVGCALGEWLSVFVAHGVEDVGAPMETTWTRRLWKTLRKRLFAF